MKKLTAFAATILLSSSAIASMHTTYNHKNLSTDNFVNKAEAYEAGYDLAEKIDNMNQHQLRDKFGLFFERSVHGITVDDTKITVEEFSESRGKLAYRAIVNVGYHYKAQEYDHN